MFYRWAYSLLLIFLLGACTQSSPGTPGGDFTATPLPTPTETLQPISTPTQSTNTAQAGLFIIRPDQFGKEVSLQVGDILFVVNPDPTVEWQIDYVKEILEAFSPPEDQMQKEPGWYFHAIAPGQMDLLLTSKATCTNPPCPPMVMQFAWTIDVKPNP